MTTREELDARLAEFDRRREAADAVLAGRTDTDTRGAQLEPDDSEFRSTGRFGRWLSRSA